MTNDKFEYLAEQFYKATGIVAPGKDDCLGTHSREYRRRYWSAYLVERIHNINQTGIQLEATHWAEAPDFQSIYFTLGDALLVWLPTSNIWANTSSAPYSLIEIKEAEGDIE